jgi:hypothetical protein
VRASSTNDHIKEGFALLGELAKLGPDPLKDSLPHIEATLAALFAERRHYRGGDPVLHNAEWAAGTHHTVAY